MNQIMISSDDNPMWKGNKEQYFALYETAANYLKQRFPDLKIGGYASCGFYALSQSGLDDKPNTSPREEYFMEFFSAFMEFISSEEHKSPLDFFSWHSYSGIQRTVQYAEFTRRPRKAFSTSGIRVSPIEVNSVMHHPSWG